VDGSDMDFLDPDEAEHDYKLQVEYPEYFCRSTPYKPNRDWLTKLNDANVLFDLLIEWEAIAYTLSHEQKFEDAKENWRDYARRLSGATHLLTLWCDTASHVDPVPLQRLAKSTSDWVVNRNEAVKACLGMHQELWVDAKHVLERIERIAAVKADSQSSQNDPRDEWLFNEYCSGVQLEAIVTALAEKRREHGDWYPISTRQGILNAVRRYAKRKCLSLPRRQ
jgi:hypothetical protein